MTDEFDDLPALAAVPPPRMPAAVATRPAHHRSTWARLIAHGYHAAAAPLRAQALARLLRPLGTLSLVAVASGAFAHLLRRGGVAPETLTLDDVARFTRDQVDELAAFAHEVDPDAVQQVASLLAQNVLGVTAISASALLLLYHRLHPGSTPGTVAPGGSDAPPDAAAPTGPGPA